MHVQIGHHRRGSQGQYEAVRNEVININDYGEVWSGDLDVCTPWDVKELVLTSNPNRPAPVAEVRQILVGDLVILHTGEVREIYRALSDGWHKAKVESWTPPLRA